MIGPVKDEEQWSVYRRKLLGLLAVGVQTSVESWIWYEEGCGQLVLRLRPEEREKIAEMCQGNMLPFEPGKTRFRSGPPTTGLVRNKR